MKKLSLVLLLIITVVVSWTDGYAQSKSLSRVKIEISDFNIETVVDIDCEHFGHGFSGETQTKMVTDKEGLLQFQSLIKRSVPARDQKSIDVRGSITFNYGNADSKYCFDRFGRFYHDGKFYFNKDLLIYIVDKVYSEHDKYMDTLKP